MKNQALFSLKDKSKNLKCRLLQFLFGAVRVNMTRQCYWYIPNFKQLILAILEKIFRNILLLNTNPLSQLGLFWTLGLPLEQTCFTTTRQCYIPNFK